MSLVFGKYCFRITANGHFNEDTPENREELVKTANPKYFIGVDQYGLYWFAREDAGYEVWVAVQDNQIVNGGVYDRPRILEHDIANEHEIEIEADISDPEKISPLQAVYICCLFLEKQRIKKRDHDLSWVLSGLAFLNNGLEADAAFHRDFEECIQDVLQGEFSQTLSFLTLKEVFQVLFKFLKMKFPNASEDEKNIAELLAFSDYDNGVPHDFELKNEWEHCAEMVAGGIVNKKHFLLKLKR